jgi:hypothetical protein
MVWRMDEWAELLAVLFRLERCAGITYGRFSCDDPEAGEVELPDTSDGLGGGYRVKESVLKIGSLRLINGVDMESWALDFIGADGRDIIVGGASLDDDVVMVSGTGVCPSLTLVLVCDCWLAVVDQVFLRRSSRCMAIAF